MGEIEKLKCSKCGMPASDRMCSRYHIERMKRRLVMGLDYICEDCEGRIFENYLSDVIDPKYEQFMTVH